MSDPKRTDEKGSEPTKPLPELTIQVKSKRGILSALTDKGVPADVAKQLSEVLSTDESVQIITGGTNARAYQHVREVITSIGTPLSVDAVDIVNMIKKETR